MTDFDKFAIFTVKIQVIGAVLWALTWTLLQMYPELIPANKCLNFTYQSSQACKIKELEDKVSKLELAANH